ncbi:MAG: carboxypeptidase regulatory-like domain-containing protein [Candidatus Binatia bacterium]
MKRDARRVRLMAVVVVVLMAAGSSARAASLAGTVVDAGGAPVTGAIVTARDLADRREVTVYADPRGRFVVPALGAGTHHVRTRAFGFRERVLVAEVADGAVHSPLRVALERETDPRELAWQLPANRWLALVVARMPDEAAREEFVRQCTYCHQQGSWATRVQRDPAEWRKLFALMARMGGVLSSRVRAILPDLLNRAYDESSYVPALGERFDPPPPADAAARRAVVTEWEVGGTNSMPHDVAVGKDGVVWAADMMRDRLYRLDPRSGDRRSFDIPRGGAPLGGVFGGRQPIPANADAHVGPHSLQIAPDGAVWLTLALGNELARFDPKAEQFTIHAQPEGLYPHTLRFDQLGRIWFTLAVSNHVGMLDPRTGERRTYRLPARTWGEALVVRAVPWVLELGRWVDLDPERAGDGPALPIPYGIDIGPDGGVWFAQLNERRIGRLDPESGAITLIDTPFPAPRRLRFDRHGDLWIPSFSGAALARFTPSTGTFKTWALPTLPAETETPYALNTDWRTDTVWICGTASDSLIHFEPATERFTTYPLPTRVTFTRELDFDASGAVWTSNSNLPAWQIEGGIPRIIRLEPEALSADTLSRGGGR